MSNQGKNRRRQLTVFDDIHQVELSVDSTEEIDFVNWCCEAVSLSVLNDFQYQPESFQLSESIKYIDCMGKSRSLFQDHRYSPDFIITFDPAKSLALDKELKIQYDQLSSAEVSAVVDVKGTFNRTGRSFSTDRKWVWQKFKIYVCEVIPAKFFKLFGCPKKSFYTKKTKKARTQFAECTSIQMTFSQNEERQIK